MQQRSGNAGRTVREILRTKKASICHAPLPRGTPPWHELATWVWEDVERAARKGRAGMKTIRKLLTDGRFDR